MNMGPTKRSEFRQFGTSGLKHSRGRIAERDANYRGLKLQDKADRLERMSVPGAMLYLLTTLLKRPQWSWDPADDTPAAKLVAERFAECIDDMSHPFGNVVDDVLTMLHRSFAPCEVTFKRCLGENPGNDIDGNPLPPSAYADGRIGIHKIELRPQSSITRWEIDEHGTVLAMYQTPYGESERPIPMAKILNFARRKPNGNPEGDGGLFYACLDDIDALRNLLSIEGIGFERAAVGLPDMQVPLEVLMADGDSDMAATRTAVENLVSAIRVDEQGGIMRPSETDSESRPTGYVLGTYRVDASALPALSAAITRREQRIAMPIQAQGMFTGMSQVGALALHSSQTAVMTMGAAAVLDAMAQEFSRLCVMWCRLNGYSTSLAPVPRYGDIETQDLATLSTYVTQLISGGVIAPDEALEEYMRAQANLPPPEAASVRFALDPSMDATVDESSGAEGVQ